MKVSFCLQESGTLLYLIVYPGCRVNAGKLFVRLLRSLNETRRFVFSGKGFDNMTVY